jgi:hypothetical protein
MAVRATLVLAVAGVAALNLRRQNKRITNNSSGNGSGIIESKATPPSPTTPISSSIMIRLATSSDIDSIVTVVNFAYRGKEGSKPWTTEKHLIQGPRIRRVQLEALLAKDMTREAAILVAIDNKGTLVGCIKLERSNDNIVTSPHSILNYHPSAIQGNQNAYDALCCVSLHSCSVIWVCSQ